VYLGQLDRVAECWHAWSTSTPFCQHQSPWRTSSCQTSSTADLIRLPPRRSGTHCQKTSFSASTRCGRSSTNCKRSYLNYRYFISLALCQWSRSNICYLRWLLDWWRSCILISVLGKLDQNQDQWNKNVIKTHNKFTKVEMVEHEHK